MTYIATFEFGEEPEAEQITVEMDAESLDEAIDICRDYAEAFGGKLISIIDPDPSTTFEKRNQL